MDNRTDAERRYDAERDGSLYATPEPPEATDRIIALLEQIEADAQPSPLDLRFDAVIDAVDKLPDDLRERAVRMWEGFVNGVAIARAVR